MKKKTRSLLIVLSTLFLLTGCSLFNSGGNNNNCGHSYHLKNDDTYHWKECSLCNDIIEKEKHTFGEWTIEYLPTSVSEGKKTARCTVCNYKIEEAIPYEIPSSLSEKLVFSPNQDQVSYHVSCVDPSTCGDVVIPETYNGYPVNCIYTFKGCEHINSLTIPKSIKTIDYNAFYGADALESVYYEGTIVDWSKIFFESGNSNPVSRAQAFYTSDPNGNVTHLGKKYSKPISLVIPEGTTTIADFTFEYFTQLTSITIPSSVTSIEQYAFYACRSLATVINHSSLSLTMGEIANGYVARYAKQIISNEADSHIVVSNDFVKYVDGGDVYLLNYLGRETSITIPSDVTVIGSGSLYSSTQLLYVEVGNNVHTLQDSSFTGMRHLKKVTLGNSVTTIGKKAFYGCYAMYTITLPASVTSVGESAFERCDLLFEAVNLTSIKVATLRNSGLYDSCSHVITDPSESKLVIDSNGNVLYQYGSSIVYVTNRNFLENVVIPTNVTSIANFAFEADTYVKSIVMPNSVVTLGTQAFSYCSNLESISISPNVASFPDGLFAYCASLKTITGGTNITSIGEGAFCDCYSLTSYTIPNSVTTLGDEVFYHCYSLKTLTIGNSVTSIPLRLCFECKALESIVIPDSATLIVSSAFEGCKALTTLTIGRGVTAIQQKAFYECTALKALHIPGNVLTICENAFYSCTALESITMEDGVTTIEKYAFEKCSALNSITFANTVSSIGYRAFGDCTSLRTITLPAYMTDFSAGAFYDTKIETYNITQYVESISGVFGTSVANIYVDSNNPYFTSINGVLFSKDLSKLIEYPVQNTTPYFIPEETTELCNSAFNYTTIETLVTTNVVSIGSSCFSSCRRLQTVTLSNKVKSIGAEAFRDCRSVKTFNFDGTLEEWNQISFGENWYKGVGFDTVNILQSNTTVTLPEL